MNLHEALQAAAAYLGVDADALAKFADETPDFDGNMPYGGMSIDREEGMFLYALVRALEPEHALEIGVFQGVSGMHILEALNANDRGDLQSYDIATTNVTTGDTRWEIVRADATTADLPPADFVYEDSDHQLEGATAILSKVKALNPRVVISHDYYSHEHYSDNVGFQVKQAFDGVFGADVLGVRWNGAPRGFGLWLNPDWTAPDVEAPAPAKKAPSRKSTTKKASK